MAGLALSEAVIAGVYVMAGVQAVIASQKARPTRIKGSSGTVSAPVFAFA